MIDLKHKTILVTGASSGIGRATAILCDKAGASVILTGRNKEELEKTKSLLQNEAQIIIADLSQEEEVKKLIQKISTIDGFVHCAGIIKPTPIKFLRSKHIYEIFNVNFYSAVLMCSYLLSERKLNNNSSVVFISSISAEYPYTGGALYASSKAAIESFCKSFALETVSKKIRANVISPGLVKTKLLEDAEKAFFSEELEKIKAQYPLGIGNPEDIANAILFLLSDVSKWITGTTLIMDGGLLLNNLK